MEPELTPLGTAPNQLLSSCQDKDKVSVKLSVFCVCACFFSGGGGGGGRGGLYLAPTEVSSLTSHDYFLWEIVWSNCYTLLVTD